MFSTLATNNKLLDTDTFFKSNNGEITIQWDKIKMTPPAGNNNDAYIGDVITFLDNAISKVDGMRADLGAIQNHINALKKIKKTKCL